MFGGFFGCTSLAYTPAELPALHARRVARARETANHVSDRDAARHARAPKGTQRASMLLVRFVAQRRAA